MPCTLTVSDRDGHIVTVTGPVPEAARTRALDGLGWKPASRKTGGTAYRCDTVVTLVDEGCPSPPVPSMPCGGMRWRLSPPPALRRPSAGSCRCRPCRRPTAQRRRPDSPFP